jgi:hypothetical protein
VLLGRRDGTTTNIEGANNLPSPFDPLNKLQEKFRNFNLDDTDLVALQGNLLTDVATQTVQTEEAQDSACLVTNLNIYICYF